MAIYYIISFYFVLIVATVFLIMSWIKTNREDKITDASLKEISDGIRQLDKDMENLEHALLNRANAV